MSSPLTQLTEQGQSIWLDFISREILDNGQLKNYIENSYVTGLTSNPTIFERAIDQGDSYDEQIRELANSGITDATEIFLALAISDIQRAADELRPVWDKTGGADGFVSLEVTPDIAHDTAATVEMVDQLWERVERPNLMIKIPATPEGIPAIEQSVAKGRNINVTLIFSLASYARVIDAYITALEQRHAQGLSLDVHSVASFFVSRVDTETDKRLEEINNDASQALQGRSAVANARLAYELFEQSFHHNPRFTALASQGAYVQRPLWASTSAKNPNYRDVLYAEALIGPDTVDTMPPATIEAFADHGLVARTVNQDYDGQRQVIAGLATLGISIDDVTAKLLHDGVQSFTDSFDELVSAIAKKVADFQSLSLEGAHRE